MRVDHSPGKAQGDRRAAPEHVLVAMEAAGFCHPGSYPRGACTHHEISPFGWPAAAIRQERARRRGPEMVRETSSRLDRGGNTGNFRVFSNIEKSPGFYFASEKHLA